MNKIEMEELANLNIRMKTEENLVKECIKYKIPFVIMPVMCPEHLEELVDTRNNLIKMIEEARNEVMNKVGTFEA